MKELSRRSFLIIGGVSIGSLVLGGCAAPKQPSGSNDSSSGGTCSSGSNGVYTNQGHSHTVVSLTSQEISNAAPGIYTLMTGAHSHTFSISSGDFATLSPAQVSKNPT